jgi:predicted nucleotidyltransferase
MPRIKDVKGYIEDALQPLKKIDGVKNIYLWGSYANNLRNPNFRLLDVDVLAQTKFNSADLISVDEEIVKSSHSFDYLENQGYDPMAVFFSKEFAKLSDLNVDKWAISCDRKLMHWGPIMIDKGDSDDVKKDAEEYAKKHTGIKKTNIMKSSEKDRREWHSSYYSFLHKYFEGMPTGWYKTENVKIKEIIAKAIKI